MSWVKLDGRVRTIIHGQPSVERPTCLYALWTDELELLYVGISNDVDQRFAAHKRRTWWHLVGRVSVIYGFTRREAIVEESKALQIERPLYNLAGALD
jgi:predicted GIY-YIG superfamily endonuclease